MTITDPEVVDGPSPRDAEFDAAIDAAVHCLRAYRQGAAEPAGSPWDPQREADLLADALDGLLSNLVT